MSRAGEPNPLRRCAHRILAAYRRQRAIEIERQFVAIESGLPFGYARLMSNALAPKMRHADPDDPLEHAWGLPSRRRPRATARRAARVTTPR